MTTKEKHQHFFVTYPIQLFNPKSYEKFTPNLFRHKNTFEEP